MKRISWRHERRSGKIRREGPCRVFRTLSPRGGGAGFTLVEVMVAVGVLIISLLGLISVAVGVIHGNAFSRQLTTGTTLAQDKIEALKGKAYGDAELSAGSHSDPGNPISSLYNRTWTVVDNAPATDVKTITVTVGWNWRGAPHSVDLVTFIARK